MSSVICAASTLASPTARRPMTSDASSRIQVRSGLARLVTIGGSGLQVDAGGIAALDGLPGGAAPALAAGAAVSILRSSCRPNRPPQPTPSPVRTSIAAMKTTRRRASRARRWRLLAGSSRLRRLGRCALPCQNGDNQVEELVAPAGLLHLGDAAAPAVGDARLGDLVVGDGVVGGDVARPHDAGHAEHAHLEVDPHLLACR